MLGEGPMLGLQEFCGTKEAGGEAHFSPVLCSCQFSSWTVLAACILLPFFHVKESVLGINSILLMDSQMQKNSQPCHSPQLLHPAFVLFISPCTPFLEQFLNEIFILTPW